MANRYFTELGTFQDAIANKKGFNLRLIYIDGKEEVSTIFPIDQIDEILDIVDGVEGSTGDFIYVWNSRLQTACAVNKRYVRKIEIMFV